MCKETIRQKKQKLIRQPYVAERWTIVPLTLDSKQAHTRAQTNTQNIHTHTNTDSLVTQSSILKKCSLENLI